jgi:hypothetical protein
MKAGGDAARVESDVVRSSFGHQRGTGGVEGVVEEKARRSGVDVRGTTKRGTVGSRWPFMALGGTGPSGEKGGGVLQAWPRGRG